MDPNERIFDDSPRFRPPLRGCVARDLRLAAALRSSYVDTFSRIAANVYRSLLCNGKSASQEELFEVLARRDLEQFRLLGELLIALGGEDAAILTRPQGRRQHYRSSDFPADALTEALAECRRSIDRFQTLMSATGDRVVRSVLSGLIADEEREIRTIERFLE